MSAGASRTFENQSIGLFLALLGYHARQRLLSVEKLWLQLLQQTPADSTYADLLVKCSRFFLIEFKRSQGLNLGEERKKWREGDLLRWLAKGISVGSALGYSGGGVRNMDLSRKFHFIVNGSDGRVGGTSSWGTYMDEVFGASYGRIVNCAPGYSHQIGPEGIESLIDAILSPARGLGLDLADFASYLDEYIHFKRSVYDIDNALKQAGAEKGGVAPMKGKKGIYDVWESEFNALIFAVNADRGIYFATVEHLPIFVKKLVRMNQAEHGAPRPPETTSQPVRDDRPRPRRP